LLCIFLLAGVLTYSIRIPAFQTWITARATSWLSSELGTTVSIDHVYIKFFSKLELQGVFVADLQNDTLLYAKTLTTDIELFSPKNRKIFLSGVELKDGTIKIIKYKDIPGLNFKFIADYFSSSDTTSSSKPFDFNPGEIKLTNVSFAYIDKRYNESSRGINFEDIRLEALEATFGNINQQADTLNLDIENLSFKEKSGFKLDYLESTIKFTPAYVQFNSLLINTAHSNVQCDYTMSYDSIDDFDDYIKKVKMNGDFEETTLSSTDLQYFAPELIGMNQTIVFSGKLKGTVDQLRGKDLNIRFGKKSYFKGDANLSGLPEINETFFDIVVKELVTQKQDLESLPTYPFTDSTSLELPSNFAAIGTIRINGKFTGFLNDFVAFGNATTDIGYISSDLNLKLDQNSDKSSYSGHLSAIGFNIGQLTGEQNLLGKISFNTKVNGSGFTLKSVDAKMEGTISQFELKGYSYSNITVNGRISRRLFNGILTVDEPNFAMDFKGAIDLKGTVPVYDFTTTVNHARIAKLNLLERDSSSNLQFSADINIRGKELDELTGFINVRNLEYSELNDTILINRINFQSEKGNDIQTTTLRSDILDFDINGNYKRSGLFAGINEVLAKYVPLFEDTKVKPAPPLDIKFDLRLHNTSHVTNIFFPELAVSPETHFSARVNNRTGDLKAHLTSDSIRYSSLNVRNTDLNANSAATGKLKVDYLAGEMVVMDTLSFRNITLEAVSDKKSATFHLAAASLDTTNNKIVFSGEAVYFTDRIDININPSIIQLGGEEFTTGTKSSFIISDSSTTINNFRLQHDSSYVDVNGIISANPADKITIQLNNFNIQALNPILSMYDFRMGGSASGEGTCSGILEQPRIDADIQIKDLSIYGDTLGNASFLFNYDTFKKIITVDAFADRGGVRNIELKGQIALGKTDDDLDFTIDLKKTNLTAFASYASDLISDVRGKASGKLALKGTLKKPILTGKVLLQSTSFTVNYLQTHYNFSDEVTFTERAIRFDRIKVNDVNGNQAEVTGAVFHNHFSDFVLSVDINAKNFQSLNTKFTDNELFYGTAYATGKMKIAGPLDLITMSMVLKAEKNTLIEIPLTNPEEVSKSNFINFINTGAHTIDITNEPAKLTGVDMTLEIDATPDAEIRLIFDSKIGDIIKGRGNGNLTLTIDPLGEFKMYGNYEVVSGDYLFTLQNLLNKKFVITPGGNIRWSGSPYDAEIDLEGIYKLKTSLYDLLQDTAYKKRVPVEVILKLSDKLFNPNISFNILVPDIDPTTETLINRYINTEQELNKQTMSLLVLNRFSRASDVEYSGNSSSTGLSANVSEVLSQQLSVWASQISDAFDVGVNYRAADQYSKEELEVALSTNLFNDRVTVDGAVNMSENNQNTSNLVGDFNVEVKVSKDGRLRFKAFNKSVENNIVNNYSSQYTQGIGIFYREEFNSFGELFNRFRSHFTKKEDEPEVPLNP